MARDRMTPDGGGDTTPVVDTRVALRKLQSGEPLTDSEKASIGLPTETVPTKNPTKTVEPTPTEEPPVEPTGKVPAGFTAGAFPKELERFFGSSSGYSGYKIETVKDKNGKTYSRLSVATGPNSSQTFGAGFLQGTDGTYSSYSPDSSGGGGGGGGGGNLSTATQDLAAQQATLAAAEKAKQSEQQRQSIIAVLTDRFKKYGLGSLVNKIKELAIDGATESTITLALQESEEYKTRFKANEVRIAKGLAVLTPKEYTDVEDGYRQTLRAYGLREFDTDEYVSQFIANDMSPTEFSNRVVTAVQRVQNADPAIIQQLRQYYGIGQKDLVAYVLDPEQQFQKIQRQVAASEIGVAAARQGLQAGVSVAEQLAAQGITEAEAQKGYATIADILPTAQKLSDIYGTTLDGYGQSEAEQEVFNSLASAQRKRQKLTQREIATFSGAAGTNKTSLTTSSVGQF